MSKSRSEKSLLNIQKLARSGWRKHAAPFRRFDQRRWKISTLTQALEQEAKRFSEDAKLSCEFKQHGKVLEMPVEIQNELFRIAQEAMTNVRKHAQANRSGSTLSSKTGRRS